MTKQIETIMCVDCIYCGCKILSTLITEKELTDVEKYERKERLLNDHIKLHEESRKYHWLCDHVRQMAEITGDLKK